MEKIEQLFGITPSLCALLLCALLLCAPYGVLAQEQNEALKFPTSEEDIIKILGVEPPENILKPHGGFESSGNDSSLFGGTSRGLASIADDKDVDEEAPAETGFALARTSPKLNLRIGPPLWACEHSSE